MPPINIAIVGLGARTFKRALGVIISDPEHWQLVAATDPIDGRRAHFQTQIPNVPVFQSTDDMIAWKDAGSQDMPPRIEAVYVAVPHYSYAEIIPKLLSARIHVLKEKPAAMTPEELLLFQDLARSTMVILNTAGQRRYGSPMARMKEWLHLLGEVSYIEAKLKICISDLAEGWRAKSALAGGGALADIGWHLVDMVTGLATIGQNDVPVVEWSRLYHVRQIEKHDCEDSAEVILGFPSQSNRTTAHLTISRIGHEEKEEIICTGEKGVMTYDGKTVHVYFVPTVGKENLHYDPRQDSKHKSDVEMMFAKFYQQVHTVKCDGPSTTQADSQVYRTQDMLVTRTLQEIYRQANYRELEQYQKPVQTPTTTTRGTIIQNKIQGLTMEWPIVDDVVETAVATQLHEDISIYGNGGVFQRFETEFKAYHGASSSYALLHNSGTNALYALYYAAGFKPGDEVIFPVYTFHATCSPAMHFGVTPIFCDAIENGTISASAIANAITDKTKAIVVTHM